MFIHFDKQKMHVQVIVGTEEEYKPSDQVKEIQLKVNSLKEKLELFQKNVIFPSISIRVPRLLL